MAQQISIDRLLNLVPENANTVLTYLSSRPELAGAQDRHGYSLLHAATSYGQTQLLKALVNDYHVDVNLRDEDDESPLFAAETVDMARILVEDLHADTSVRNGDGQTAEEKLADEDEQPLVAAYLRQLNRTGSGGSAASVIAQTGGAHDSGTAQAGLVNGGSGSNGVGHPPLLPQGMDIQIGTMEEPGEAQGQPDPEFRRRIEELAARDDFQGDEAQAQLRNLIQDAMSGLSSEGQGSATRRRLD